MSYAQEKLYEATLCLISDGPLRKRLAAAALYIIRLMPVHFANSEHLKAWQRIYDDIAWVEAGPGDDGNIDATIKRMIDDDVRSVADAIFALYHNVSGGWRD
jgi:hypothetical protein